MVLVCGGGGAGAGSGYPCGDGGDRRGSACDRVTAQARMNMLGTTSCLLQLRLLPNGEGW